MTNKPRLLCLVQLPPPTHGVTVVNEAVVSSRQVRETFELDIVPLRFARSVEDVGAASVRKLGRAIRTSLALTSSLLARRPALAYFTLTPFGAPFLRDCAYVALLKLGQTRRVYHLHNRGFAELMTPAWRRRLYRWAFEDAWVIHLSERLRDDTKDLVDESRVVYVANGVRDPGWSPVADDGPLRVLFLSNMIAEKGPLVLVEALALLDAAGITVQATFAGARFRDRCVEAFEAAVTRHGLSDRVRYVGPIHGEAKDELFRSHHVVAYPSFKDAFPLVILEAMSHGRAVVATTEGAIPDIVAHGQTGFLVPPRDPTAFATRLRELAESRELVARLGRAARHRYEASYTLEQFEARLSSALRQICEAPAPDHLMASTNNVSSG